MVALFYYKQIDKSGWTFNPSVSVMIYPEHTTNLVRGQGFRNNSGVFYKMMQGDYTCQDILDYFGFEGEYNPELESLKFKSGKGEYWGSTNRNTGLVSYGNFAFDNYSTLYGVYIKELYHARKFRNGQPFKELPESLQGLGMDTYLEEIYGYIYAYKNQGLFRNNNFPFNGVDYYQNQLALHNVSSPVYPSRFTWIYKIHRLW